MSWAIITHIDQGVAADRPAANAVPGRHYGWWSTDTKELSISDGSTWTTIGPSSGGDVAGDTHAASSKNPPVDADEIPLADSAASFVLKKLTWANLKATLKTYFDSLYSPVGGALAPLGSAYYNPSGGVVTKTGSTTMTAVDTTNLRATFTAPASGNVIVKVGIGKLIPNNCNPHIGFLDGSTTKGSNVMESANGGIIHPTASFKVTGLTPGNSYSYDLAIAETNAVSHSSWSYGFSTSNLVDATGPAFIEVWSA